MASNFSGVLQLTDLNDFITPSQECVKPITIPKSSTESGSVFLSDDGNYYEKKLDGSEVKLEKTKISLADCLACSGCITSAESVLISEQSQEEFLKIVKENNEFIKSNQADKVRVIVVSICPQSFASLGAKFNMSMEETAERVTGFFHNLGVQYVFDATIAREFSLIESQHEFTKRYLSKGVSQTCLPVLSSVCPGWVCYAEKTHGDYILPYISSAKSPQQVMGSLVKDYLASTLQKSPNMIYHVTVMPCFDKKLEASRKDFYSELYQIRDVDCVITSIEVEAMLENEGLSLSSIQPEKLDSLCSKPHSLYRHSGSTSGGYCDNIFKHAAKKLFGEDISDVQYKTLRNQDLKEVTLEKDNQVVLRFAIANGFRNIQNIVQKLKRGKSPYHFVEIMACPSGCANGGAQIRPADQSPKEVLEKVENLYRTLPVRTPGENELVDDLYCKWLLGKDSDTAKKMLHTEYHTISKTTNPLLIKWFSGIPLVRWASSLRIVIGRNRPPGVDEE